MPRVRRTAHGPAVAAARCAAKAVVAEQSAAGTKPAAKGWWTDSRTASERETWPTPDPASASRGRSRNPPGSWWWRSGRRCYRKGDVGPPRRSRNNATLNTSVAPPRGNRRLSGSVGRLSQPIPEELFAASAARSKSRRHRDRRSPIQRICLAGIPRFFGCSPDRRSRALPLALLAGLALGLRRFERIDPDGYLGGPLLTDQAGEADDEILVRHRER